MFTTRYIVDCDEIVLLPGKLILLIKQVEENLVLSTEKLHFDGRSSAVHTRFA